MPVVTVEVAYTRARIVQRAQPQRGEVEACRPALGAFDEQLDICVRERDALMLDDELASFLERESELPRADLAEISARP